MLSRFFYLMVLYWQKSDEWIVIIYLKNNSNLIKAYNSGMGFSRKNF